MRPLAGIQAMRGVAAGLVLVGHAVSLGPGMGLDAIAPRLLAIYPAGVDIFFVISGFIINRALAAAKPSGPRDGLDFAWRRITRLYPLYWIVLIASATLSLVVPITTAPMPHAAGWALVTLTDTANWLVPQAWTLAFEVYFYAAISTILLVAPRRIVASMAVWLAVQAAVAVFWSSHAVPTHALVLEFGLGSLISFAAQAGRGGFVRTSLALSAGFFGLGAILAVAAPLEGWTRLATYGLGAACLIHAVTAAGDAIKFPRALISLGDASYSIYLWHIVLLVGLRQISERTGLVDALPVMARPGLVLAWVALVCGFALASYRYLERPLLGLSRRDGRAVAWPGGRALRRSQVIHRR